MTNSRSIMTELVLPNDTNLIGNLLGGRLLHWIDIAGALAATRYSSGLVATVTMDMVEFTRPIKVGSIVTLTSYVTWTGNTSMETAVEVFSEDSTARQYQFINKVYWVYVGIDSEGNKRSIPLFVPQSVEERIECEKAVERKRIRIADSKFKK